MKRNYDKYIEIIENHIQVDWNFRSLYEKIINEIIVEYEKEKMQPQEETTFNENPQ